MAPHAFLSLISAMEDEDSVETKLPMKDMEDMLPGVDGTFGVDMVERRDAEGLRRLYASARSRTRSR